MKGGLPCATLVWGTPAVAWVLPFWATEVEFVFAGQYRWGIDTGDGVWYTWAMGFWEIGLIAVGLSMDAFAVSVTLGLQTERPGARTLVLPGVFFGAFQALMPVAGYFAGVYFATRVQQFGPWVAFVLLAFLGGKMIKEAFERNDGADDTIDSNGGVNGSVTLLRLTMLAVATSIDALAVGVTFAFFNVRIFRSALIIGITTLVLSICGVKIGALFGKRYKAKAECVGGIILVAIGIKIVAEHLLAF